MSRQSTLLSASSQLSATINGHAFEATESPTNVTPSYRQTISLKPQDDGLVVDPDELFTKHTIPEVKAVQHKLLTEAGQKKYELRLMVGERYRDVLQASASIISMAESSKNVLNVLKDSGDIVSRQHGPPVVKGVPSHKDTDTHLHALQQLAAHVKILIDAPENLWRLIEQRKYFSAAWLFLLVRVVHRTLIRDNEREDIIWRQQGIDVLSEFPLVQRQWDVVSQFRPQIVHKATLSLRDLEISPEDACAALVTLHLLDSRPLTETFSVYLTQRTKTLTNALTLELQNQESASPLANGHASAPKSPPFAVSRTSLLQEVREAVQIALLVVAHTIKSTRDIFEREDSGPSLMYNLLKRMQPDGAKSPMVLPSELCLTTPSILATLPSSIPLQLLSPDLKDYRPYIDLDSSSSMVSHVHLTTKLAEWHSTVITKLEEAFQQWLERLQGVKDVWNVRSSVWKWVSSSHLKPQEVSLTLNTMDNVIRRRILGLWRDALRKAQDAFKGQLNSALISIEERNDNDWTDLPANYLFHPPPLPQHSQLGFASKANPFEKHYSALRKCLLHRTRLLDAALGALESCARAIQEDISVITSGGPIGARDMIKCLVVEYRPLAQSTCEIVFQILDETERSHPESAGHRLALISEVIDGLASTSCFVTLIGCSPHIAQGFRHKLASLYDKVMDRWRHYVVSSSLGHAKAGAESLPSSLALSKHTGPSPELLRSLGRLSESALQLGLPRDPAKQSTLVERMLRLFVSKYLQRETQLPEEQREYDLALLHQLVKRYGERGHELRNELALKQPKGEQEKMAEETLIRCQNLIAPLLPYTLPDRLPADKQGFLLPLGIPVSDTQYQSPISVSKPGPRLGQLLVEGTFSF